MPDFMSAAAAAKADSLTGYSVSTFIWGVIGSMISMKFVPQLGFWQKVTSGVSGTATAIAGTPIVKLAVGIEDEKILFGVAFFIGLFGLSLTAAIFDMIRNTKWRNIIESRLGKSSKDGSDIEGQS